MNNDISLTIYTKNGNKWEVSSTDTNPERIYKDLADDLIRKKLFGATSIKSIKHRNNYNGTREITVYYDNNVKRVYIVEL